MRMGYRYAIARFVASMVFTYFVVSLAAPSTASALRVDAHGVDANGVRIHATVTGANPGNYENAYLGSINLKIRRDGELVVDRDVESVPGCWDCTVMFPGLQPVKVLNLGGSDELEVVFTIFSGGAHCCSSSIIYYKSSDYYRSVPHYWGNQGGPRRYLRVGPNRLMVARDDRFAYRFDCYGCSRYPVQIWKFQNGFMRDVTRRFPGIIRRDLRGHERRWKRYARTGHAAGPLAAWAADMCLLGRCSKGLRVAGRAARRGAAKNSAFPKPRFMVNLKRTLGRFGYMRR